MQQLQTIGCTEILFALQENHVDILTGALNYGARIAQDHGLKPYAVVWGFANTFGGGRMSRRLLNDPSMWRVSREGTLVPVACLNNPALAQSFIEITEVCARHGYQGMFVDEPSPQDCFCTMCQDLFFDSYGKSLQESIETDAYRRFQLDTVNTYTRALCKGVKAVDRNQTTITCLMPTERDCFEVVAAIRELDVFGTDPYWLLPGNNLSLTDAQDYARSAKEICRAHGKSSQVWLNCWKIPAGSEMDIYTGGKQLAAVGCDSLYTWSFQGGLGTYEECANPELAWASVVRLYQELSAS